MQLIIDFLIEIGVNLNPHILEYLKTNFNNSKFLLIEKRLEKAFPKIILLEDKTTLTIYFSKHEDESWLSFYVNNTSLAEHYQDSFIEFTNTNDEGLKCIYCSTRTKLTNQVMNIVGEIKRYDETTTIVSLHRTNVVVNYADIQQYINDNPANLIAHIQKYGVATISTDITDATIKNDLIEIVHNNQKQTYKTVNGLNLNEAVENNIKR